MGYDVSSINIESIGSRDVLNTYVNSKGLNIKAEDLDITTYNAPPNWGNNIGCQVGKVYEFAASTDYLFNGLACLSTAIGFYYKQTPLGKFFVIANLVGLSGAKDFYSNHIIGNIKGFFPKDTSLESFKKISPDCECSSWKEFINNKFSNILGSTKTNDVQQADLETNNYGEGARLNDSNNNGHNTADSLVNNIILQDLA